MTEDVNMSRFGTASAARINSEAHLLLYKDSLNTPKRISFELLVQVYFAKLLFFLNSFVERFYFLHFFKKQLLSFHLISSRFISLYNLIDDLIYNSKPPQQ